MINKAKKELEKLLKGNENIRHRLLLFLPALIPELYRKLFLTAA